MNTYALHARDGRVFLVQAAFSGDAIRLVEKQYGVYISCWFIHDGYKIGDQIKVNF